MDVSKLIDSEAQGDIKLATFSHKNRYAQEIGTAYSLENFSQIYSSSKIIHIHHLLIL